MSFLPPKLGPKAATKAQAQFYDRARKESSPSLGGRPEQSPAGGALSSSPTATSTDPALFIRSQTINGSLSVFSPSLRFPSTLRMSDPIILSDDEDRIVLDTPLPTASKKRRTGPVRGHDPPVLILDDDPTPKKFSCDSTPSFVAETPFSEVAIVKCTSRVHLHEEPLARASADCPPFSGQCFAHYCNM